ncbi:MAG: DUF3047 domain-containing protein [Gammaproteobacteria bacterium]
MLAALVLFAFECVSAAPLLAPFSAMQPGEVAPPWQLQTISGRPTASFRVVYRDSDGGVVEAIASGSVASLIHPVAVDPQSRPTLKWRWRVFDPVDASDIFSRAGDDFPARIYVMFDLDLGELPFAERWKLRIARVLYGSWVPSAALCYVPSPDTPVGTITPNAYSARIRMIVVDGGQSTGDEWVAFSRDVVSDYEDAFGGPAPRIAGVAIAIDTDDTGETAGADFGDVELDCPRCPE